MLGTSQDQTVKITVEVPMSKHRQALGLLDEIQRSDRNATIGGLYASIAVEGINMRIARRWKKARSLRGIRSFTRKRLR